MGPSLKDHAQGTRLLSWVKGVGVGVERHWMCPAVLGPFLLYRWGDRGSTVLCLPRNVPLLCRVRTCSHVFIQGSSCTPLSPHGGRRAIPILQVADPRSRQITCWPGAAGLA